MVWLLSRYRWVFLWLGVPLVAPVNN